MRILLLSAYHADSHKYWCDGLVRAFPEVDWTLLTLPARHFSWRIRGNSLTWAYTQAERLHSAYDLIIATSMVDLAGLRGLQPQLGNIPTAIYFHENQFAYPRTVHQHPSIEPQMVNLYSALCADQVVFNSNYNRCSFFEGVDNLLQRLPDGIPPGLVAGLEAKSRVVPVPLESRGPLSQAVRKPRYPDEPLNMIWNHRWEYDKCPERLLAALQLIPAERQLKVHVTGQKFRKEPAVMSELHNFLQERGWLGVWGYVAAKADYHSLLVRSHCVLSTAIHDFQGLAVLEAVAAGCIPLVPRRLAYSEWFGAAACYLGSADVDQEARALARAIETMIQSHRGDAMPAAPNIDFMSWPQCRSAYQQLFSDLSSRTAKAQF